ncbi:MAG: histidine--tRNA ligase [Bacteriovoracaceae bacterium]|nr:histidine--tRNA ligase [Bacteriovoracaceae bacterium]
MALSKKPYKGTRDFFPVDKRIQDFMFKNMKHTAHLFGYESYDGPMLEEVELYKAKSGEELINEQIYSFTDRGNRFVAIRPEMTPTVARMVAGIHKEVAKPIRWFSIPNLYRYERPQKGRLREHWQFNCDIFGAPGREGEIEILQVAVTLMENYGADSSQFEILLNDRAIVDTVFTGMMKCDEETTYRLYKIVDKAKKVTEVALADMVTKLDLTSEAETIFYQYLKLSNFEDAINFISAHGDLSSSFHEFVLGINDLDLREYVKYDPTIVRGLDYYTGIVFEIFDKNPANRRAICGGGAYANLLKIFNEAPMPGVGFGLGDVTLRDFLETHKLLPNLETAENDIFVTFQDPACRGEALKLAQKLRKEGVKVITHLEPLKFKKVFTLAAKKGVKFVTLMGDRELEAASIQVKKVESKEQFDFALTDIKKISDLIK